MIAMEIVTDRASKSPDAALTQKIIDEARGQGLLVTKCGIHRNVARFLAPLVTTEAQIDEALAIVEGAFQKSSALVDLNAERRQQFPVAFDFAHDVSVKLDSRVLPVL